MRTILGLFLTCLMIMPASLAANLSPRQAAVQTPDGAAVRIVLTSGETIKGRLSGVSPDGVTITRGRAGVQPRKIGFAEMQSFKQRPATGANILAGAGVGFLVLMVAIGAILGD